ncbi:MAG: glycosyltransferase [Candidatus Krumholzibacteriia bacterium]
MAYSPAMRILHVGKYYPPQLGGMETVLRLLCEGLLARGHEVTAVVSGTGMLDRREALPGRGNGPPGTLVRVARLGVAASQPLTPSLPAVLARELRRFRPHVVHLHLPNPLAAAAWLVVGAAGNGRGGPVFAVWHHADIVRQRLGGRCVTPLVRSCLARCDGISVSSVALRDGSPLLAPHRAKTTVIPFGIDPAAWAPSDRPARRPPPAADAPFLFVGRLVPYKGVDLLVDAVGELPSARLEVVGDGPLGEELRTRIEARGWQDRIVLLGALDGTDLARRMWSARALVLPSRDRSETFGLVQIEAMAAGLPVIVSRVDTGVAGVTVDGVTGRHVPPGDPAALRAALDEVLTDPALGVGWGDSGRRRVEQSFTAGRMVEQLEAWYHGLVARCSCTR